METDFRSTVNLDGIGLFAPCGGLCMGQHRGLEGSQRAPCRRKSCEEVARSLKMNVDSAPYLDAGMAEVSRCGLSSGKEVGEVITLSRGRDEELLR
jgi:hypothetical protein